MPVKIRGWNEARRYYRKIRLRSEAKSHQEFDLEVRHVMKHLPMVLTCPSYWIAAAKRAQFICDRCSGTGQYKSPIASGVCFRCEGKGYQNDTDVLRNEAYDRHNREHRSR